MIHSFLFQMSFFFVTLVVIRSPRQITATIKKNVVTNVQQCFRSCSLANLVVRLSTMLSTIVSMATHWKTGHIKSLRTAKFDTS